MLETKKHVPVKYRMNPEMEKLMSKYTGLELGNWHFDCGVFINSK